MEKLIKVHSILEEMHKVCDEIIAKAVDLRKLSVNSAFIKKAILKIPDSASVQLWTIFQDLLVSAIEEAEMFKKELKFINAKKSGSSIVFEINDLENAQELTLAWMGDAFADCKKEKALTRILDRLKKINTTIRSESLMLEKVIETYRNEEDLPQS